MAAHEEEQHELYDGIMEYGNPIPGALIASFVVTIMSGFFFTLPLWGARPSNDPLMMFTPITTFYNFIDARPWWDVGYTLMGVWIAATLSWIAYLIKADIQ